MAEVTLRELPGCARFVLRGEARDLPGFGPALPTEMLRAEAAGKRAALRLGPDEWLLLAEAGAAPPCPGLVEISDGRIGFALQGADAALVLNEGCPLDLDALPVGGCTRTLYAKAEILLWRQGPTLWRVEVARSFAPYLRDLLEAAARDL